MKESLYLESDSTGEASMGPVVYQEQDVLMGTRMPKTIHWSVPWSDLMMTMFILFAILYVYHSSTRQVSSSAATSATVRPDLKTGVPLGSSGIKTDDSTSIFKIYDLSKQTLRARDLESFASVELVEDKAVRIILTGDLLFDTGKADLKSMAKRSLEEIAPIIRRAPYMVSVIGHTDHVPIHTDRFPTNWELSAVRACQVARFLIEEMRIPADRFYVSGNAYYQPVRSNNTATNRATNRRVEIVMTKEKPYGLPARVEDISNMDSMIKRLLPRSGGL